MSFSTNLNVNQDLLDLLKNWDTDGEFAKMGLVFDFNSADFNYDTLFKAIAYSWIYIQNTEPEMTADQFLNMLNNADDWNAFYKAIFDLGVNVMGTQYDLDCRSKFKVTLTIDLLSRRCRGNGQGTMAYDHGNDGELPQIHGKQH